VAKNIEGEWDKKAKIDEDYQKVLEKIKDGKELSEDDVKKIEAYKKRYTNRELPETVQVALDKHKQAIEDKKLKAGMYASAQFGNDNNEITALVVPHSAFVGSVSQNKIFKIVNNKAEMVNVKSGRNFGDKVEIISGLTAGDEVITSGQINIDNGTPIKIVQ